MFSYSSYLLLGALAQEGINIPFLAKNGYELSVCNYSFSRAIDQKGEVQTKAHGGIITLCITGVPTDELIEWAMSPRIYKDGAIVFHSQEGGVAEKLKFYNTACINMNINFVDSGKSYTSCNLTLSAETLSIGSVNLNNKWIHE